MKREQSFAPVSRTIILTALVVFVCLVSVRAQTVVPRVCVETGLKTGTVTLAQAVTAGVGAIKTDVRINGAAAIRMVINPGGANEETRLARSSDNSETQFTFSTLAGSASNPLIYAHSAGETIRWEADAEAFLGYHNLSEQTVVIPRGVTSGNYFSPISTLQPGQPNTFLSGIHDNVFSLKIISNYSYEWRLQDSRARFNSSEPGCVTITYQGRLSDVGAAANGQYDLRFTAFDALTGGAAQSAVVAIENAQVTNGIFTVQLNFYSAFSNNNNARFLEIAVRAATSTGEFTILTPRQPISTVPFAVNAQTALTATNVSGGFVQLPLTTNAPPAAECDEAREHGRQKVDVTNNRLYVCTNTGWKSAVLQ
jgi:hypothetical protein